MGESNNLTESELKEKPEGKVKAFLIQPYGTRYFAIYEGEDLICVTVYKKGAMEVKRRLEIASNLAPEKAEDIDEWPKHREPTGSGYTEL